MGLPEQQARGGQHHAAKLDEDKVRAAWWLHEVAGVGISMLSRRFAVDVSTMRSVLEHATWRHLSPDAEKDSHAGRAALAEFMEAAQASAKQVEKLAIQAAIIRELETALHAVLRHHPKGMAAPLEQLERVERNSTAPRDARELAAAILRARRALLSSAERRVA